MANIIHSIFSLTFILNIVLVSFPCYTLAGRHITNTNPKQPDCFIPNDGTILIPGIGRVVVPPKGSHINPFTYNPITGTNTGNGFIPNPGTGAGIGIPGGDNKLIPKP
ncbi:unnamed protein product [Withania somnifera]